MEARTVTLVASTVNTITFTGDAQQVEVVNVDGDDEVFFVVDASATPTVAGNDEFFIPAIAGASLTVDATGQQGATVVKLISAGTPKLRVTAVAGR